MEIRRLALPKDHPDIARSLNNLAGVYKYQNRYREAEQLYREALHIFQNSLGDTHQYTKVTAQNLQIVLDEKKDHAKPRDLFGAIKNLFAGKR
jgi:tetratricopeptide (TPR) repeat protein